MTTDEIMALADAFAAEVKNDYQGMDGVQRRVACRAALRKAIEALVAAAEAAAAEAHTHRSK